MAFNAQAGASNRSYQSPPFSQYGSPPQQDMRPGNPRFEIFEWQTPYLKCVEYFLNHAQHEDGTKALCMFLNIRLPCQKQPPIMSTRGSSPHSPGNMPHLHQQNAPNQEPPPTVSLVPFIRRLVATGHDQPPILHGFFGNSYVEGISQQHEVERRNFLFAAKSESWLTVKMSYDMGPDETIPYLATLTNPTEPEIAAAEAKWSEWMAMGDWMVGPRAPDAQGSVRVKREHE